MKQPRYLIKIGPSFFPSMYSRWHSITDAQRNEKRREILRSIDTFLQTGKGSMMTESRDIEIIALSVQPHIRVIRSAGFAFKN